ncbi:MAG: NADH-quinone oxidoreductase subunit A [Candidatus Micrarchaeota archaeon]|nr:NADH-quinone oxidoreductase subunit A [Candidatus Micrarchaeota archaeon]
MPASFILTFKLIGRGRKGNPVKNAPYESGEETIGSSRDIDNEYLPHFMIFLPFEVIMVALLLWSLVAGSSGFAAGMAMMVLGVLSTALALVGYRIASG